MEILAYGRTDVGRGRDHNEDFMLYESSLGLHVVCDGMGGHAAGEVASETAATTIREYVAERADKIRAFDGSQEALTELTGIVRTAIERASGRVYDVAANEAGKHGMGTTCVTLLTVDSPKGAHAIMGHVGDSRVYLHRDGRLHQLSEDHTYVNEAVRNGMMTFEEAAASPHAHMVTRGVGVQPSVRVDTLEVDFVPGDTFMLCSDGLHGYFEDARELGDRLGGPDVEGITEGLVDAANDRGGDDNISVIVVRGVEGQDPNELSRKTNVCNDLRTLRYIALFMDMTMGELVRVFRAFTPRSVKAGEVVIREGEYSDGLFVAVDGELHVTRHDHHLAVIHPGGHFGEMALLNQRPRSATVTASEDSRLLVLNRKEFAEVLQFDPPLACKFLYKLAQVLSLRLDENNLVLDDADARKTQEMAILSPFRTKI